MESTVAFIFDMDGVIIDSNPVHKIALIQFCKKHGHELTEEILHEKIYGRTNKDWITNVFGDMPEEQLKQLADEKEALFREIYTDVQPVPGLISFLEKMDKYQIPRAIGTSAPRANVDFTLTHTHTEKFFDVILHDTFVTKGKPDPEIYTKACAALKLPPAQCVVFEDSLAGVQAGKAAGCKVVGITTTHTAEELSAVDTVIDDFQGLDPKELVAQLF